MERSDNMTQISLRIDKKRLEKRDSTEISFRGKRLTKKDRIKKSYMVMQDVNYQLFN